MTGFGKCQHTYHKSYHTFPVSDRRLPAEYFPRLKRQYLRFAIRNQNRIFIMG